MHSTPARFTATPKIIAGLAIIIAVGMSVMLLIYRGLNDVEDAVDRLASVEGPLNAAAYEMEVNVNGIGLAVLKYLAGRNPRYRIWIKEDNADFLSYHATYARLVKTKREKELAAEMRGHYAQFIALGSELMDKRDKQEALFMQVTDALERIDHVIDTQIQPAISQQNFWHGDRFAKAVAIADLEAEAAEVGFWLSNYQRVHTPEAKAHVYRKMEIFRGLLARYRAMDLDQREQREGARLQRIYNRMVARIDEVIALEDYIGSGREKFIDLRMQMDRLLDDQIQALLLQGLDVPRQKANAAAKDVQQNMRYLIPLYLLAAGIVGFLLIRFIIPPLRHLKQGTEAVRQGDLDYRIAPLANDEFGDLAKEFNRMVDQLQTTTVSKHLLEESEERLRQTVIDLRREILERERSEKEREKLQAELRRTETMSAMGALVAGVAHEVRNPLFSISSTLDAMNARFAGREEFSRYAKTLHAEVDRLGRLMRDLLEYGKPPVQDFSRESVGEIVEQALKYCLPLAGKSGIIISNRVAATLPAMRVQRARLIQVFQNLLQNAILHSPAGGTITVEAQKVEEAGQHWLCCRITDEGSGFKPDDLPHIFQPFFTRRRGGTGLGLPIVQRIIDEHRGRVTASNRPEGGACLTVCLPFETPPSMNGTAGGQ